jgi:hypothetical protein
MLPPRNGLFTCVKTSSLTHYRPCVTINYVELDLFLVRCLPSWCPTCHISKRVVNSGDVVAFAGIHAFVLIYFEAIFGNVSLLRSHLGPNVPRAVKKEFDIFLSASVLIIFLLCLPVPILVGSSPPNMSNPNSIGCVKVDSWGTNLCLSGNLRLTAGSLQLS